ncbi:MAG: DUF1015 domain-containing protein, partial [Schleiferiaceae bacterium]|nr:DUF1015 domain-containing protein [Schleiferiaceae bacterium]
VKPFKALRPTRDKAYLVATRSYVSYTDERLRHKLENNPFTFLHVINPDGINDSSHGQEKFEKVKKRFELFCKERIFKEEEKAAFYIYQQQTPTHVFTGIIGGISVKDYNEGRVKKHEHTITAKENLFAEYLNTTGINTEPVLLIHKPLSAIGNIKNKYMQTRAEYEFTSTDRIMHLVWPVSEEEDVKTIADAFAELNEVYIADGHHRCASSSRLAQLRGGEGENAHDYFMAYMLPETTIKIQEFNRVVRTLNGLTKDEFLNQLEEKFFIRWINTKEFHPSSLHEIGLYIDGDWYALFTKPGLFNPEHPVEQLDCHIVSTKILAPILNITDERNDKNIDFLPGSDGAKAVAEKVDSGEFAAGFVLFPITMDQLKNVADAGMYMPPKSTYIEPKMRSGLTIYNLD